MSEPDTSPARADKKVRRLAAIMFADMSGYTALMQENEPRAKILRDRKRRALETYVPQYHGNIIQYFGDGALCLYHSAIDAVKSSMEIQAELQKEPKVLLRIGLHSGDVVLDGEGVYGDCVNLASRIEALSMPGAILISDKVYDEVKNQPDIQSIRLGKYSLKNVNRPVEVYAIANEGLFVPGASQISVKAGAEKSIAVLPFVNMSADPENEYFSDGISEEILNSLSHVTCVQVMARSSSFSFKGKHMDVRQIGKLLGVTNILEGSVRRAGKKIRISAQLVDATDGYHIWSEEYNSELEDIFEIQEEISRKILARLSENFAPEGKETELKSPTGNLEAYNLYLRGRYYWNKSNPETIKKAIGLFERAIDLDQGFALPYCALSYCYSFMGSAGLLPPISAFATAKDYTLKAIELDPGNAESHLSLAAIKFFNNWDFTGAESSLKKALSLNLNSSFINQVHGWFLIAKGEFNLAINKMDQALQLDPISLPLMCNLGDAYSFAGRFEEALAQYDKILEMDPAYRRAIEAKGLVYLALSDHEKAIENFRRYHKLIGNPLKGLSSLGYAYAVAGYTEKARECLEKTYEREKAEPNTPLFMDYAFLYSGLKDMDKTFYYLHKAFEKRHGMACLGMIYCIRYPMPNEMKSDPRFGQLIKTMGLPPN